MTETYGPITRSYQLPAWEDLPPPEKYARMARQGHGMVTSLPVRVVKTRSKKGSGEEEAALEDVAHDGCEVGEVAFGGNMCAAGYYGDKDATRRLFEGGWLRSGDLAVAHAD